MSVTIKRSNGNIERACSIEKTVCGVAFALMWIVHRWNSDKVLVTIPTTFEFEKFISKVRKGT
jgi:hypothetical protein